MRDLNISATLNLPSSYLLWFNFEKNSVHHLRNGEKKQKNAIPWLASLGFKNYAQHCMRESALALMTV